MKYCIIIINNKTFTFRYQICIKPFIWKDIQPVMNLRALLQCPPNQVENKDPFFIQVKLILRHQILLLIFYLLIKLGSRKYGTYLF